jgi:predicted transcriptional regulator of viral defense system
VASRSTPAARDRTRLALLARHAGAAPLDAGAVAELLAIPRPRANQLLHRLVQRGWLARLRRGAYLVRPLEALPGQTTLPEDAWAVAHGLFAPCYIAGWSAAEHWQLTEQVFRSTFIATAAHVRGARENIAGLEFRLARIAEMPRAGLTTIWRGTRRVSVSDPERTLVDALVHPDWLGGIRNVADALRGLHDSEHWDPERLARILCSVDRGSAFKRLGHLIEALELDAPELIEICRALRSAGRIRLDPAVIARGKTSKRWGLLLNVDVSRSQSSS